MAETPHLELLNEAQRAAVTFDAAANGRAAPGRPLLIIAGAGSGKTNTLAHRVAHLILCGADPRRMLLLTFTRRAAEEMTRRVERICGTEWRGRRRRRAPGRAPFMRSASRLLRLYAEPIGLDPAFTVLDRSDAADLMDLVRDELGFSDKARRFPKKATCLAIYSYAVECPDRAGAAAPADIPLVQRVGGRVEAAVPRLCRSPSARSGCSITTICCSTGRSMMALGPIAADVAARFDFVLVDEYQDTNALQAEILLRLKPDGRGLTVVGDDAQAIYGFRAATVRNILDFPAHFSPPAAVLRLEQNYRSTQPILDAANAVMQLAPEGYTKSLFSVRRALDRPCLVTVPSEDEQVDYVVRACARESRGGPRAAPAGGAVPHRPSQRPAGAGARRGATSRSSSSAG